MTISCYIYRVKNIINKKEGLARKAMAEGIISISSKGIGYVAIGTDKNKGLDPEIDFRHLNTALHGDTVEILFHPKGKGRQTAEVSKIISRAKKGFAGILEKENNFLEKCRQGARRKNS